MYDIASRNLPIFDDFSLYYVLCMHVTYKTKNAIQILICDKKQTEHRPIITCWLWIPLAIVLLTRKKRYVGEKSISVDKIIRFWIKENRQFSVRHDCLLHKQYNSASCNKFYVFCLFILKSIFAQLYVNTLIYTYKCM